MSFQYHTLLLVAGLAGTANAVAQTNTAPVQRPVPTEPQQQSTQARVSLDELASADVILAHGTMDKNADKDKRPKGKIKDLVISTRDGRISSAAVSVGGMLGMGDKVVLIPVSSLHYAMTDNKPSYEVRMTEEQLKGLAEFDVSKAAKDGLDRAVMNAKSPSTTSTDAAKKDMAGTDPKAGADVKGVGEYVLASQLKGGHFHASDTEFGKVHNASVDTGRNAIDYLLISQGGTLGMGDTIYILPYQGLTWTHMDDKNVIKINKSAGDLKTAPEYEKPDKGFITADQMKQADTFAGIRRSESFN